MDANEALVSLEGGHLDTVSFVMDYVEFPINYNVLRALAPPIVEDVEGLRLRFPEPGSRDALCGLIDTTVESAAEVGSERAGDRRIEVRLDDGGVLVIPLTDDAGGPERAHLVPADERGELQVAEMFHLVGADASAPCWTGRPLSCDAARMSVTRAAVAGP